LARSLPPLGGHIEDHGMSGRYEDRMMSAGADRTLSGTVKRWNDNGYGFIKPDSGADVFVHIREVLGGRDELYAGDRVSYELGTNPRNGRTEAKRVTVIEA
jgi:cold shock protein